MFDRKLGLLLAILYAVNCTAITTFARPQSQTKPADQTEAVRLRTELIQVQVVVTDKQGRIIENLKRDDFELMEQGHPQEVSFFSLERVGILPSSPNVPGGETVVNPQSSTTGTATPSRSILFFLDTLHLSGPSFPDRSSPVRRRTSRDRRSETIRVRASRSGRRGWCAWRPARRSRPPPDRRRCRC